MARRQVIRLLALGLALLSQIDVNPVFGFGPQGPNTHITITLDAIDRFGYEAGWEVDPYCAEWMNQASVFPDQSQNGLDYALHCDNSEIAVCSLRLDILKNQAEHAAGVENSIRWMGHALHIIQDFYAHSNYVEYHGPLVIPAPLERYKDSLMPPELQSGYFPDVFPDLNAQLLCYLQPEERWGQRIYGATHACINKDGNRTLRGGRLHPAGGGLTYHELAAQYAREHSVQFLHEMADRNPWFRMCLRPRILGAGCTKRLLSGIR
jgi:Heterokaryon incompatibility protein Het-C